MHSLYCFHLFNLEKTCARLYHKNLIDWKDVGVTIPFRADFVGHHYNDNIHEIVVKPGCTLQAFRDWKFIEDYENEQAKYQLKLLGTFPLKSNIKEINISPKFIFDQGITSYSCNCTWDENGK